jgi:2-alkenal reductase
VTSVAVAQTQGRLAEMPQGIGSGFVYDNQGRIITNNHVVQDADELRVTFRDGTTVPAQLLGRDEPNDLAVIQVDPNARVGGGGPVRDLLQPVTLGHIDQVVIGAPAIAIGSPLGLQQTVTEGIVSALRLPGEDPSQALPLLGGAIQTDAAINRGNSGGPLFNADGELIGVNSAILSPSGGNIGIGFAIPVNVVQRVVPELINQGCYRHPLIGITALPIVQLGPSAQRELGVQSNQDGLLVLESSQGAADAGIRAGDRTVNLDGTPIPAGGDIIVAIDGRAMNTVGELRAYIENNKQPGDAVTVTVLRNGNRQDLRVVLTERPDTQQMCR